MSNDRRDNSGSSYRADDGFLPLGEFERQLGKDRQDWNRDDLVEIFHDRDLRALSLMHVGGDGWLKTLDFVPHSKSHLQDVIDGGERADGSNLFEGMGIPSDASDIVLHPRVRSAFMDPFSPLPTMILMCSHLGRDGKPLPQSPDTVLRKAAARLESETGITLTALGEVEYFLGKKPDEGDIYGATDRGYHASSPFVFGEELRRKALSILAGIGVPVKYGHSEVGYIEARETESRIWEQHEIELSLLPLPEAADAVLLTQWILRKLAHSWGMRLDTSPMAREGHAGNGLHFHFSPVLNGKNLDVRNNEGRLNDPARWLIGGLVRMGGALMTFGNRVEESFARLSQAKEAPSNITWGDCDRSALVRIPIVARAADGRVVSAPTIEFRLPDGSALPHLLLAGATQAMAHARNESALDDLIEKTASRGASGNRTATTPVPRNFDEVADALDIHRSELEEQGVFPKVLIDSMITRMRT